MKIKVLGTGTSQGIPVIGCDCEVCLSKDPKDNRLRSSVLVESGGTTILIDTGPDLRQQMLADKPDRIDAILYTHEHNDHTVGLDDIRPFNFKQGGDMPIYGLSRVMDTLKNVFHYAFTNGKYPGAPRVKAHPIDGNSNFKINDVDIIPIHVFHGELPILGYRIDDFAYLTDVSEIPDEEYRKLKGVKVVMLDALRHESHHSHLTLEEAVATIQKINPEKAFLTHVSHMMGKVESWESTLPEGIKSAYDGQLIMI